MKEDYGIRRGFPFPMGVTAYQDYINIAIAFAHKPRTGCGIIFYDGNRKIAKIPFTEEYMTGVLYTVRIESIKAAKLCYQFYLDDEIFVDAYAKKIIGREKWAKYQETDHHIKAEPADGGTACYDWENDKNPHIPYEDSILYSLHVRGFTKHASSRVNNRGTFEGLTEKIPYLKELGITGILCMPLYEFDEIIKNPAYREPAPQPQLEQFVSSPVSTWKYRINYWGFGDCGNYYMAPKAAYAKNGEAAGVSLRDMVKKMHQNGIEVLMQIYFTKQQSPDFIRDVLRFWTMEYHMDGFQIMGMNIPMALLAQDPVLGRTKLICERTDGAAQNGVAAKGYERNIARYTDGFRADCRRFIKGDEDMLYPISQYMRENSQAEAVIHHITDYRGFTLSDLVSYDYKHNEANGENNRDGSDYNYSWNCGQEGPSRKKAVLSLRLSQRKNAITMLLMAQATPLLLAGDEFGHSSGGNNNAYCQDNKTNWLNWNTDAYNKELLAYVKDCIAFRKAHPILHRKKEMCIMDTLSCGYPDMSYHGEQAWYTGFENYNRHFGIMYCGLYEAVRDGTDNFIYLAMNMHWIPHRFALPQLPAGYCWKEAFSTRKNEDAAIKLPQEGDKTGGVYVDIVPRSIMVLTAAKSKKKQGKE